MEYSGLNNKPTAAVHPDHKLTGPKKKKKKKKDQYMLPEEDSVMETCRSVLNVLM